MCCTVGTENCLSSNTTDYFCLVVNFQFIPRGEHQLSLWFAVKFQTTILTNAITYVTNTEYGCLQSIRKFRICACALRHYVITSPLPHAQFLTCAVNATSPSGHKIWARRCLCWWRNLRHAQKRIIMKVKVKREGVFDALHSVTLQNRKRTFEVSKHSWRTVYLKKRF